MLSRGIDLEDFLNLDVKAPLPLTDEEIDEFMKKQEKIISERRNKI